MAMFGSKRDAAFVRGVNREMIHRIVDTEIALYKLSPADTKTNIYGESSNKIYYSPIRIHSLITEDESSINGTDFGDVDTTKTIKFAFLRDDLVDIDLVIEISDIIKHHNLYFEVDNVITNSYWFGRDPDTLIGQVEGEFEGFGMNVSVIVEAHMTAISNLNIQETRSGNNSFTTNTSLPRNL